MYDPRVQLNADVRKKRGGGFGLVVRDGVDDLGEKNCCGFLFSKKSRITIEGTV
jgi:hypothetical protein